MRFLYCLRVTYTAKKKKEKENQQEFYDGHWSTDLHMESF